MPVEWCGVNFRPGILQIPVFSKLCVGCRVICLLLPHIVAVIKITPFLLVLAKLCRSLMSLV